MPELQHILKPSRGPWITNQMLLPTQGSNDERPTDFAGSKHQTAIGQKRNIADSLSGVQQWQATTEQPLISEIGEMDETRETDLDEEMSLTFKKKAKAARPLSPLEI